MTYFRTRVQLPPPPPGFVRNAVQNEACHGIAQRAKPGSISTIIPNFVSNYALASLQVSNFHYVHILVSEADNARHYMESVEFTYTKW